MGVEHISGVARGGSEIVNGDEDDEARWSLRRGAKGGTVRIYVFVLAGVKFELGVCARRAGSKLVWGSLRYSIAQYSSLGRTRVAEWSSTTGDVGTVRDSFFASSPAELFDRGRVPVRVEPSTLHADISTRLLLEKQKKTHTLKKT